VTPLFLFTKSILLLFCIQKAYASHFVYRKQLQVIYFIDYVHDIIIIDTYATLIQDITTKLHATFSLKQLGQLHYFLGLEIKYSPHKSILMTQTTYIQDLLHKTHMVEVYSSSSPMVSISKLSNLGANLFSKSYLIPFGGRCYTALDQKSALL